MIRDLLALASGGIVGFSLGLVGGGGSVLAVPLLAYVVGVASPHVAIGTSALAVAANAAVNLTGHWRAGTVKFRCALVFAAFGIAGAAIGSTVGKAFDGDKLLALFGLVMIVVGITVARRPTGAERPAVRLDAQSAPTLLPRLAGAGLITGLLSGFFGIGGGFMIVPGLIAATSMPIINAVGSSLVSVTGFGLTTAGNYALSGLVDWWIALLMLIGGSVGGMGGVFAARRLAGHKRALSTVFAVIVCSVGVYVAWRGIGAFF